MTRRLTGLDEDRILELERLRDSGPKAYLRERAAAILKIAEGIAAAVVARALLLKPRKPDTVYDWLNRYEKEGIQGLVIKPGRGRKPAFSPSDPTARSSQRGDTESDSPRSSPGWHRRFPLDARPHQARCRVAWQDQPGWAVTVAGSSANQLEAWTTACT